MVSSDIEQSDRRFSLQAGWSRQLREYIFRKYLHQGKVSVLEVGSGTGSVLSRIRKEFPDRVGTVIGIDKDPVAAAFAAGKKDGSRICIGNGELLPFGSGRFDFVFCHFLMLWVNDAAPILREMKRVTVPGGICAALAEPCYGEMTASPDDLKQLGLLQREAMAAGGADLWIGKKLGELFRGTGFRRIEHGKYGSLPGNEDFLKQEIEQMLKDTGRVSFTMDPEKQYQYAVPTYYAIAEKEEVE